MRDLISRLGYKVQDMEKQNDQVSDLSGLV